MALWLRPPPARMIERHETARPPSSLPNWLHFKTRSHTRAYQHQPLLRQYILTPPQLLNLKKIQQSLDCANTQYSSLDLVSKAIQQFSLIGLQRPEQTRPSIPMKQQRKLLPLSKVAKKSTEIARRKLVDAAEQRSFCGKTEPEQLNKLLSQWTYLLGASRKFCRMPLVHKL